MTELNLRGLVERKKDLLFLGVHENEFTAWNHETKHIKAFNVKADKMYTTTLALTKRRTKITRSISITVITAKLHNINIRNRRLILTGQQAEG